jgi:formate hydrogenlyase transcriptional activator
VCPNARKSAIRARNLHENTRKKLLDEGEEPSPSIFFSSLLESWSWPRNVRELENFIERSVILSRGSSLRAPIAELRPDAEEHNSSLQDMERAHILGVFRETGGVISVTANRLGIPRTTLNASMKKLGITRSEL